MHYTHAQSLKKELLKLEHDTGMEVDTGALMFAIMDRKYPKERKRAKLLAALLTYSDANVNERAPSGMTAIHCAMRVRVWVWREGLHG